MRRALITGSLAESALLRGRRMRRRTLLGAVVASLLPTLTRGQGRRPRLAILSPAPRMTDSGTVYGAFTAALAALGWAHDRNLDMVERFADFAIDRIPTLAAELVSLQPDVIFTFTNPGAYAAAETFRSRGLTLVRVDARGADEIDAAFAKIAEERVAAIHVPDDAAITAHGPSRHRLIELALAHRLPVASTHLRFAAEGSLITFSTDIPALARRAATYVDKILKGATPAELPVERPTMFKLAVNLKTAKALGISLPSEILLRADEVIE